MAITGRHIAIGGASGAALMLAAWLITGFEDPHGKPVSHVYPDPVSHGAPWTYCDGETIARPDWHHVYSVDECNALTVNLVTRLDARVMGCVGHPLPDVVHPLPVKVRAAFDSLAWNIGSGGFCASSVARKALAGDLAGACTAMLKFDHAGGRPVPGLTIRRSEEYSLCLDGAEGD